MLNDLLLSYVDKYLCDAGFNETLYTIEKYDTRDYIEVYFISDKAIDYIMQDIIKSDFSELLEIKKFNYKNGNVSAIISMKDNH